MARRLLGTIQPRSIVRRTKGWQLALAQHPMYLIIREDEDAAERIPPWGAPSIEAYIDRLSSNLDVLDSTPELKIGFDWSGAEVELLATDAPGVLARLRSLASSGRVGFYNGTYGQPHLHVLSSEANYRQFEAGSRSYRDTLGVQVVTYAHQEPGVHDQVPQLLRAFGFTAATVPGFLTTLTWLAEGFSILHGVRGPRFLNGRELTTWRGLDGSTIPLLLHQPIPRDRSFRETLAHETVIGALSVPRLLIDMPDMAPIDDEWLAERSDAEMVLLDPIIADRLSVAPPVGLARLTTSWSYLEGLDAELLARSVRSSELAVMSSDAIQTIVSLSVDRGCESSDDLWKAILRSQHHDVFCFSAPGLRRRAVGWLEAVRVRANVLIDEAADALAARIGDSGPGDVVVFGVTPHPTRSVVEVNLADTDLKTVDGLIDVDGRPVATDIEATDTGIRVRFVADLDGFGYRTFRRSATAGRPSPSATEVITADFEFVNADYRIVVGDDGTVKFLGAIGGDNLLRSDGEPANRLSATDSGNLGLGGEPDDDRLARLSAPVPLRGPTLSWASIAPTTVARGQLGARLTAHGRLGPDILVSVEIDCYRSLARVDIRHRFTFDEASVGTFFDDESKLLLHWPLRRIDGATHDIPFGAIDAIFEQSIFPTSWLDLRVGDTGLQLIHAGTPRHWIADGEVVRLVAWGQDTDAIGNRLGRSRWLKGFDQRLRGTHVVESAVLVHPVSWGADQLFAAASEYCAPPAAHVTRVQGVGEAPLQSTLAALRNVGLHSTYISKRDDALSIRVFAGPTGGALKQDVGNDRPSRLRTTTGEVVDGLGPWQIGEVLIGPGVR